MLLALNCLKDYMINILKRFFPVITSIALIIGLWEFLRFILINFFGNQNLFFPSSKEILKTFVFLFIKIDTWLPIINTFLKSFVSLILVTLLSIPFALFLSKKKKVYNIIRPAWDFFRSIPPAMLFPLFIVIVGIGDTTKVIIAVYFSFLILSLNLTDSFISIFNEESHIWKIMDISLKDRFRYYIFPQILDSFFSNLRIVGSIIIALVVISEMYIGKETGIGKALSVARENYEWSNYYSYIIITGIVGMLLNNIIDHLHNIYTTKK